MIGITYIVQGHEGCGTVIQVGSEAKGFKPGDAIGWLPIVDCCFDCEECQVNRRPPSEVFDGASN